MNSKTKIYTASTNLKPKQQSSSSNTKDQYLRDEKYAESKIIEKYLKKGFASLAVEELAVTLISPTFESEFQAKTGTEWPKENKAKAIERLNFAKFNIQWNASMNKKSNAGMLKSPFGVLFDLCERGDIQRITEYFKKNAQYMNEIINTVDTNKKSLLHITAKAGHTNLLLVLLQRGFSVHFRDKFLRTPLHIACQFGRETCADELIKAGSDIYAKDTIGRTCLHYACCSDSVNLVTMIFGNDPDLVHARDTYGRTPLHYAVWNGTSAQVEICQKLLEAKAEIDALDDEQMTPLHFAADAGKGKVIPILLKYGANPFLRDGRTHRTSLELASTDRIREIIIVYSSQEYKAEIDKLKLTGQKINLTNSKEYYNKGLEEMNLKGSSNLNKSNGNLKNAKVKNGMNSSQKNNTNDDLMIDEDDPTDKQINSLLFSSLKKKLISFLRNIQNYGVKSMQHLSKPELYSGSWLEKVNNVEDLYKFLSTLSSPEAAIAIFNVLSPYTDTLPKGKGDEPDLAYFFNKKQQGFSSEMGGTYSQGFQAEVSPMQAQLLNDQKKEINSLKEQIALLNQKIDEGKQEVESAEVFKLKMQIEKYQNENLALKDQSKELITQVKTLTTNLKQYETKVLEAKKNENAEKDKVINTLKSELTKINTQMEKMKKTNAKTTNYLLSNTFKTSKAMIGTELSLSEESSIYIFLKLVEVEGLDKMLVKYDKDNDLHLLKHEFISLLDDISLPFEHKNPIIKVSGFEQKQKMPIKKILEAFYKRGEGKTQKLNEVLYNFSYKLIYNRKNVEDLFDELNKKAVNKEISLEDTRIIGKKYGFDDEDMKALFECWEYEGDSKGNGMINIDELSRKLQERKKIIEDVSDMNNIVKFGESMTSFKNKNLNQSGISVKKSINGSNIEEEKKEEILYEDDNKVEGSVHASLNNSKVKNSLNNSQVRNSLNNSQVKNSLNNSQVRNSLNNSKIQNSQDNVFIKNSRRNSKLPSINNSRIQSEHNSQLNQSRQSKLGEDEDANLSQGKISNKSVNKNIEMSNPPILSDTIHSKKGSNVESNTNNEMIQPKATKGKMFKLLNPNEKINGELKVQVKKVDDIVLPNSIKSPYAFLLGFTLEGINQEFDSKEVVTDDLRSVSFNWSTRTIISNKTLKDLASNCSISLKIKNKNSIVTLGHCMFNWTKCLIKGNIDKFVIDDNYQLLNKRQVSFGFINIKAKFIPFGSENSLFDANGKKKTVPPNLNGLVKEEKLPKYKNDEVEVASPKEENVNENNEEEHNEEEHNEEIEHNEEEQKDEEQNEEEHQEENNEEEHNEKENNEEVEHNEEEHQEEIENNDDKHQEEEKNEEEEYKEEFEHNEEEKEKEDNVDVNPEDNVDENDNEAKEGEEKKENEGEEDEDLTIIKEVDAEIINIVDKDKIKNKDYYISITDMQEGFEIYSSKDETKFSEIVNSLPFKFNFTVYTTKSKSEFKVELSLKLSKDDSVVASLPIAFSSKENYLEISEKYDLLGKAIKGPVTFYMKYVVNTVENE